MTDTLKEPEITTTTTSYTVDYGPKVVDGSVTPVDCKPFSSSVDGNETDKHLLSRKKTEHTTQQITTTTKVIREFHHIGPNGQLLNEQVIECPTQETKYRSIPHPLQSGYEMDSYRTHSPTSETGSRGQYQGYSQGSYDYDPYSRRPHDEFYGYTTATQGQPPAGGPAYDSRFRDATVVEAHTAYNNRPPTPPSPTSLRSESPPPLHSIMQSLGRDYPASGYAELDGGLMPPNGQDYRNTPSPALHGVPSDRYAPVSDVSYEGSAINYQQQPNEGFPVPENHMERPVEDYYGRMTEPYEAEQPDPYTHNDREVYGQFRPESETFLNGNMEGPPIHEESHTSPLGQGSPQVSSHTPLLPQPPSASGTPVPGHDIYGTNTRLRPPSADSISRVRWRDPDLHEVIDFLSNPNSVVKANAAAYLQHLCFMDNPIKQKTRLLGGIPPLVALLSQDTPELYRNACGALRNLSYGRLNDDNKRTIKEAGGIGALVRLLHKSQDNEVKELVTGVLWNLSSCEELKQNILDDALSVLVNRIIIPCSGWGGGEVDRDPNNDVWWSTVFKNASGVLRNISSAGEYARTRLRQCPGLVDSLFCVVKLAIQGHSHDNKSVENCVCILRNLSYRCQEVEDPNYDKNQFPTQSRASGSEKDGEEVSDTCGDNLGCFGGSRKKRDMVGHQLKDGSTGSRSTGGHRNQPVRGMELLWQPDLVVQPYLALLSDCSNPETLEAAAGALQNLAACYWQPSIDVRAAVRKEKGLPILVELLRMEVDRVVCAVATALRNLAIDQRNKELIGKYAMRDLVQKLPSSNSREGGASDETIAAVLATLNEVIKKNAEFSRTLLEAGGVERLNFIAKQRAKYSSRVVKFASQVLFSLWSHQELREVYKKSGWKEQDFVSKSVAARSTASGGAHSPTANNTLNRPMASQGGTRYEDRTIQRANHQKQPQYVRREEVPLADLAYGGDSSQAGNVRLYPSSMQAKPGEPVYAKVNRERKRTRQFESVYGEEWRDIPPSYSAVASPDYVDTSQTYADANPLNSSADAANNNDVLHIATNPAGDSWV